MERQFQLSPIFHASMHIERAFGVLKRRWGIMWRPLEFSFQKWSITIMVCAKLHNFCIETQSPLPQINSDDVRFGDDFGITLNDMIDPEESTTNRPTGNLITANTRLNITQYLETIGVRRPDHAIGNSRA